jgi:ABC-type branched-subunit amino acid transport system substrate-binding protein
VLLGALALVAASCGDRGDDTSGGVGGGDSTTEPTTDQQASAGDWGDLEAVCGPNEGGGEVPAGDDSLGVSADEIVVGTVADPGFTGRPGLNQELFDSGDAFVEWCNAAGGINGKKLVLNKHDAKLTEYQPAIEAACDTDFALVGGGAVQDNLWSSVGAACGLIDVAGFAVTPEKAGLSGQSPSETRNVQPVPNPGDTYLLGPAIMLQEEFPDAGKRHGFMYSDFQTIISQKNKEQQAYESIGHEVVHEGVYNVNGESNWKPFAQAIADDEVQFLKFIGEPANGGALIQALDQIDYEPEVRYFETNFYDQVFLDAAGPAADGVLIGTAYTPIEEAADNPATQSYVDILEAQGGKQAILGVQSVSAWLLFAALAKQCDLEGNLTRTCILEGAEQVTEWTGGGLHAPTNPAENTGSTCAMVLEVVDGTFQRYTPDEGFECDDSFAAQVDPG